MITHSEAVAIGKAICSAAVAEIAPRMMPATNTPALRTREHVDTILKVRNAALAALTKLWHDVFPPSVRNRFGSADNFFLAIGWNELF